MTFLPETPQPLFKLTIDDIKDYQIISGEFGSTEAVSYLDGYVRGPIMGHMARRYCRVIVKSTEKKGDHYPVYNADPIRAIEEAIASGLFEIVPTGLLSRVCRIVGNLGQETEFDFVRDEETDTDFSADITKAREDAGFHVSIVRAEEVAVACGSCVIMVQILGGKLNYQVINPDRVWFLFAKTVDNRPVNPMNIDEASAVVIQIAKEEFVAYFGACDKYPQGRMVRYESNKWSDIPPVGKGLFEHLSTSGEVSNPLTVLRLETGNYHWPEYPVAVWSGASGQTTRLLATDPSLYQSCLELDLANSRTLTTANKSASGLVVFSMENGASSILPDNIAEGTAILNPGQSVNLLSLPSENVETLGKIVRDQMSYIADSYGIPPHLLSVSQQSVIPSGAALMQLNEPLQKMRDKRADINQPAMNRVFEIECCLARIENDDANFADGIVQRWIVNNLSYAQTEMEKLEESEKKKSLGTIAQRDIIRRHVPGMSDASDEEVDKYIEEVGVVPSPEQNRPAGRFGFL